VLSAFIEGPFRGNLDLSSFLGVDFGFFLFALLFCDYSVAPFLVIDVESLFERFRFISFQYSASGSSFVFFHVDFDPQFFLLPSGVCSGESVL
jgi:hypothetical protein